MPRYAITTLPPDALGKPCTVTPNPDMIPTFLLPYRVVGFIATDNVDIWPSGVYVQTAQGPRMDLTLFDMIDIAAETNAPPLIRLDLPLNRTK